MYSIYLGSNLNTSKLMFPHFLVYKLNKSIQLYAITKLYFMTYDLFFIWLIFIILFYFDKPYTTIQATGMERIKV